jgi:hypothetical protein
MSSVYNSSRTALGISQTFTGQAENCVEYTSVSVSCYTDQNGTLYVEFSNDSINWDFSSSYSISASVANNQTEQVKGRYYRCRLVNGATAQTLLRLQTVFKMGPHNDIKVALDSTNDSITVANTKLDSMTITSGRLQVDAELALTQASDSVLCYGFDGSTNQKLKTDASGELQVDVLNLFALDSTLSTSNDHLNAIKAAAEIIDNMIDGASGKAKVQLSDGSGNQINSTTNSLHVNVQNSSLAVTGTFWQATQPVSGTFWQATQPVSGTFWQATQPVSILNDVSSTQVYTLADITGASPNSSVITMGSYKYVDIMVKVNGAINTGGNLTLYVSHNNSDWFKTNTIVAIISGTTTYYTSHNGPIASAHIRLQPDAFLDAVDVDAHISLKL